MAWVVRTKLTTNQKVFIKGSSKKYSVMAVTPHHVMIVDDDGIFHHIQEEDLQTEKEMLESAKQELKEMADEL